MAINFEAANMAGYNNPKIEVFKAVADTEFKIVSAPKKSEIYDSLRRGCIPFIRLFADIDGIIQQFLMPFSVWQEINQQAQISFTVTASFGGAGDPQTLALVYDSQVDWPPRLV